MTHTIELVLPQWQGGMNANYMLGAELMKVIVPHSPQTEVISVPVAKRRHQKGKAFEFDEQELLIKQLITAKTILELKQPTSVITVGGDCSTSLAAFDYLNGYYHGKLGVVWLDAHPDISTPADSQHLHEMVVSSLLGQGAPAIQQHLKHPFNNSQFLMAGLVEKSLRQMDQNIYRYHIKYLTPQRLQQAKQVIVDWVKTNQFSAVAVHLDLDVFSPKAFRSIYPAEPGTETEEFPAAVGELDFEQVFGLLKSVETIVPINGFTIAEHMPWDAINLQDNLANLTLFNQ